MSLLTNLVPAPYRFALYGILAIALFGFGYVEGYSHEHKEFAAFELQVKTVGEQQDQHTIAVTQQQKATTANEEKSYNSDLLAINKYYDGVLDGSSGSKLSGTSSSSSVVDANAPDPKFGGLSLTEACTKTTLTLDYFIDNEKKQEAIK